MMWQLLAAGFCLSLICPTVGQAALPQVDLGYEIHQALYLNTTSNAYFFTNIRYAQPPLGNLRFAAPIAPTGRNTTVQNGSAPRVCPQAAPAWTLIAGDLAVAVIAGNVSQFNFTQELANLPARIAAQPASATPGVTEDCLFLDVVVPKPIFDNAHNLRKRTQRRAPVLLWIYGGGYTFGSKAEFTRQAGGLIRASQRTGGQGVIVVTINYRLGAFGFLGGPTLQGSNGTANAALYDQRLAIEWVKNNIDKFGGDPNQITLVGESAGGGSIEHQITAFGGQQGVSFQRAVLQSPGFLPIPTQNTQENSTLTFLGLLNVTSIAAARNLSSAALMRANALQVGGAAYGQFVYGPTVDGVFVPQLPSLALNNGAYAKNVTVMTGYNANEGVTFSNPGVTTQDQFASLTRTEFPGVTAANIDYITNVLYPPVYNGSYGYRSPLERTFVFTADFAFVCNTNYLQRAAAGRGYAYTFQVPPAFHGSDIQYTFYDGQGTNLAIGLIGPIAELLQAYITNFVQTGNPNGAGVPFFPAQGTNASITAINVTGVMVQRDASVGTRCSYWQKALFY